MAKGKKKKIEQEEDDLLGVAESPVTKNSRKPPKGKREKSPEDQVLDSMIANIEKKYGKGSIMVMGDAPIQVVEAVSTGSLLLDQALGQDVMGYARGRIIEIFGPESSGKTTLTLHAIAEAQKAGGRAGFIDAEHALDIKYAANLGVDVDNLVLSQPDYGEQALEIVETMVRSGIFSIVVIDSVSALVPKVEVEGDMGQSHVGLQARLMSQACRKLAGLVSNTGTILFFVNQIRCVSGDSFIFTERGLLKASESIKCEKIAGINNNLVEIGGTARSFQPGKKIQTKDGRQVICGFLHPILSIDRDNKEFWLKAKDVKEGDWLSISRAPEFVDVFDVRLPDFGKVDIREKIIDLPSYVDENICAFLGMWFADGSILDGRDRCVTFTERSAVRRNLLISKGNECNWHPSRFGEFGVRFGTMMYRFLNALGCERGVKNKTIPNVIQGRNHWRWFLRYMFDSHPAHKGFMFTVGNNEAARQIQTALLGFNINSRVRPVNNSSHIYVSGCDAQRYIDLIGFAEENKEDAVLERIGVIDDSGRGKADIIPFPGVFIKNAKTTKEWKTVPAKVRNRVASILCQGLNLSRKDFLKIGEICKLPLSLARNRWVCVTSVSEVEDIEMFDFDVPNGSAFVADGFVTHNSKIGVLYGSPETTSGGNALKFYASVRLDIRRKGSIKKGDSIIGNHTKVKVVKNKLAPPFRTAEFDIMYGKGINRAGELVDLGVELDVVSKAGSFYSYKGDRLGQGRENSCQKLRDNPGLMKKIEVEVVERIQEEN